MKRFVSLLGIAVLLALSGCMDAKEEWSGSPSLDADSQSACKGDGLLTRSAVGSLAVRVTNGIAYFSHTDVSLNCASQIVFALTVADNTQLTLLERNVATQQADCVCLFDLSTQIKGLQPGTYTLHVVGGDNGSTDYGTTTFTIQATCTAAADCAGLTPVVDCVGAWACENAGCIYHCETGCTSDAGCASGETCMNGTCRKEGVCVTDTDCSGGGGASRGCVNGECVTYCDDGGECHGGLCIQGVCRSAACGTHSGLCQSSCGEGRLLDTAADSADCPSAYSCCKPEYGACSVDSDCAPANIITDGDANVTYQGVCVNGACVIHETPIPCTKRDDCNYLGVPSLADCSEPYYTCENGSCVIECGGCADDSDCSSDAYCSGGPDLNKTCEVDSDCYSGQQCGYENAKCKIGAKGCLKHCLGYTSGAPKTGVCKTRCPDGQIVCGTDYKSYTSACAAYQAGGGVLHNGECGQPCYESNECASGQVCKGIVHEPQTLHCNTDSDCMTGMECRIVDDPSIDGDCGEFCGTCYSKTGGRCETSCRLDSECGENSYCKGPSVISCTSDADCPTGSACAVPDCKGAKCGKSTGICSGGSADLGTCAPNNGYCTTDSPCRDGYHCSFSEVTASRCALSSDCATTEMCFHDASSDSQGWCRDKLGTCRVTECDADSECAERQVPGVGTTAANWKCTMQTCSYTDDGSRSCVSLGGYCNNQGTTAFSDPVCDPGYVLFENTSDCQSCCLAGESPCYIQGDCRLAQTCYRSGTTSCQSTADCLSGYACEWPPTNSPIAGTCIMIKGTCRTACQVDADCPAVTAACVNGYCALP